ncbi:hypothetical protein OAV88_00120 [bacterium]|jgi:hypothetical protein|nr:hypothetical protein [bacterium]
MYIFSKLKTSIITKFQVRFDDIIVMSNINAREENDSSVHFGYKPGIEDVEDVSQLT